MCNLPDNPIIRDAERNGYPTGGDYDPCPICGSTNYVEIYKDRTGEVFACDDCVNVIEWWEYEEERKQYGV